MQPMIPDTKPGAGGLYWKDEKIYFRTSPLFFVAMIPAMAGASLLALWGIAAALGVLFGLFLR